LVSIFSAWDAGTLPLLTLLVSVIQRAPEDLAWQDSGGLALRMRPVTHRRGLPEAGCSVWCARAAVNI